MRGLGLSFIDAGQVSDGVAMVGLAYRSDSALPTNAIAADVFGTANDLRSNLSKVSRYANRDNSASSWLTLAALMQAEGRNKQALTMLERAKAAGLAEDIAKEMAAALATGPRASR